MNHEQTIGEIIETNLAMAIDQSGEYDIQEDSFAAYFEGDAYAQNTLDSALEYGYTPDEAMEAQSSFILIARENGVRFAS
jgi:hypothetical protein